MRKRKSDALNFEVGELNLVPYMDIMVNLIIFMLFTMSGFVQMKVINVSLPAIDTGATNSEPPPEEPEKKLAIVLAILDKKGFIISLNGQIVNENLDRKNVPRRFLMLLSTVSSQSYTRGSSLRPRKNQDDSCRLIFCIFHGRHRTCWKKASQMTG